MSTIAAVLGRLLIAIIFVISGAQKLIYPATYGAALREVSLPATLSAPLGIFEIAAALLLGLGLMTRLTSLLLFLYSLLSIFFLYNQFADPVEGVQALKFLALAGGLLLTFAYGQMRGSYDHLRATRREQQAELRAAHAEGRVEGATHAAGTAHPVTTRREV